MSSSSKKTLKKIYTPKLSNYEINTPNCDIQQLELKRKEIQEKIKNIEKIKKKCKSRYVKEEYKKAITLRELLYIILSENKNNIHDFLDLFAVLNEGKTTVNTIYEALWILIFLYKLDDLDNTKNRIFYKSIENPEYLTHKDILDSKVNEGNKGGIADIYFKIEDSIDDIKDNEFNCGDEMVKYPYCTTKITEENDRYMCSVKYFQKEKDVGSYDVDKIRTEAQNIKSNILLLVNDKDTLIKKYEKTGKFVKELVTDIYGINDLNKYYLRLLYKLKNKDIIPDENNTKKSNILYPRLHQKYFINYTHQKIKSKSKSKNFIWGAVPRSGKSYMIGGLISKLKPDNVLLFLGAITETKKQFINDLFLEYDDFNDYEIYDLQTKSIYNKDKSKKIIIYSQEWARLRIKDEIPDEIQKIINNKNKIIFFDEIHQGSGGEKQDDILNEFVFNTQYIAFIMVTATFAKPYLRYMNKSDIPIRVINWSYENIQNMKRIQNNDDIDYILEKIKLDDDGESKSKIFKKLIDEYIEYGGTYKELSEEYLIYPNLVVINIDKNLSTEKNLWYNNNLDIEGIFKPLMKNKCDKGPIKTLIKYIFTNIYSNILYKQGIHIGSDIHSQLWFLPTILKNNSEDGKPFSYMCKNIVESIMEFKEFRDNFCIIILHKVGFDKTKIDFISSKKINWNEANINNTNNYGCVSTICSESKMGVKNCILAQESCAKKHGKSVIILTGKMIRLGISLPCVDVALHFDPISSVDTVYQSMFRVLTERKNKEKGIFIDMNHERNINFMYDLYNYQSQNKKDDNIDKQMKDFNEFLILYDLNGLSNYKNDNYQNMYDKILEQFSLNNKKNFINKLKINKLQDIFKNENNKKYIEQFYNILLKYNIEYNKKPKEKELNIKYKENEVVLFINDYITLFILFNEKNIKNINIENIKKNLDIFINEKITNIIELCNSNFENKDVLNCHLLNLIANTNKNDKEINKIFNDFKNDIKQIFNDLAENTEFLNIYDISMIMINEINDSINDMKINPCIKSNVLDIIRDRLTVRKEEKNLYGEVFTPIELVCEMLDKIPNEVWKNPNLKWLDPANGIGNFPVVVYYKLMESLKDVIPTDTQRSRHIIENMLYMVEINPVNSKVCEKIFDMIDPKSKPNIKTMDSLELKHETFNIEKFNIIIGNPPFQKSQIGVRKGGYGGRELWGKFVELSLNFLEEGGILGIIHPPPWRKPEHNLWNILSQKQILYLHINGENDGKKIFNASTRFDMYVLENKPLYKNTEVIDELGNINSINLSEWLFLPNYDYDNIKEILTTEENGIDIIYSSTIYDTRKPYLSKEKNDKYKYPIVHTITQKGLTYMYTDDKSRGQFGIPKVLLNFGRYQYNHTEQNDYKGDFGMSQITYGIPISSKKEGDLILNVIGTDKFKTMIKATKWSSFQTDWRMFKYFKKDFYKYF